MALRVVTDQQTAPTRDVNEVLQELRALCAEAAELMWIQRDERRTLQGAVESLALALRLNLRDAA